MDDDECLIFLSHSGRQKHVAEDLFMQLKRILCDRPQGAIFFDRSTSSIPMGSRFDEHIWRAIDECKVGVLLLSAEFLGSKWPMLELERLVERSRSESDPIRLYPIFYDIKDTVSMRSEEVVLHNWKQKWSEFGDEIDVEKWARYLVELRFTRGEMLASNNTVAEEVYNIAVKITDQLPEELRPSQPLPPLPSQASYNRRPMPELKREPAPYQYTTTDSLLRAERHCSFYMHPWGYRAWSKPQVPRPALLGQKPDQGNSAMVNTLVFADGEEAERMTRPIGAGSEWWELIWSDHGSRVGFSDHSCWRVRPHQIPPGFVCLSPCFFRIDSLQKRMSNSWIPMNFLGLNEGHVPPSIDEVEGMVAVRQHLVAYVPAVELRNLWDDRGSQANQQLAIYTGPDFAGCFGFPNYDPPPSGDYPILDQSKFRRFHA